MEAAPPCVLYSQWEGMMRSRRVKLELDSGVEGAVEASLCASGEH